jgi:hypothetical protein
MKTGHARGLWIALVFLLCWFAGTAPAAQVLTTGGISGSKPEALDVKVRVKPVKESLMVTVTPWCGSIDIVSRISLTYFSALHCSRVVRPDSGVFSLLPTTTYDHSQGTYETVRTHNRR